MAVDMFVKIDGVEGDSQDDKHAKSIDIMSWSWGLTQSGNTHLGPGSGAGKVAVQDVSFVKYTDGATAALVKFCMNGKHFKEAQLIVRKAGEHPLEYLIVKMEDLIVSSVQTGGSQGEEMLTENVTLNFAKAFLGYTPQNKDGTGAAQKKAGWDIPKNVEWVVT